MLTAAHTFDDAPESVRITTASGSPSASAGSGFTISTSNVLDNKSGP